MGVAIRSYLLSDRIQKPTIRHDPVGHLIHDLGPRRAAGHEQQVDVLTDNHNIVQFGKVIVHSYQRRANISRVR